jgi:hypothetical protein
VRQRGGERQRERETERERERERTKVDAKGETETEIHRHRHTNTHTQRERERERERARASKNHERKEEHPDTLISHSTHFVGSHRSAGNSGGGCNSRTASYVLLGSGASVAMALQHSPITAFFSPQPNLDFTVK